METIGEKIGERVKESLELAGLKQKDLVDAFGVSAPSVYAYITGGSRMTEERYAKFAQLTGVNIHWLITGEGPKLLHGAASGVAEAQTDYNGMVKMPVYAMAGAGSPCCIDALEPIRHICVEKKMDGPNIRVIEVRGNSMEPTLMDGSYVGVDITDKNVISGKLYAVYLPYEGIVVKRIWIGPELVKIESDNKSAPSHDMSIDRINWETFIQGRVKWRMGLES